METQILESALTPLSIAPDGLTVIDAMGNVFAKTNFPVDASKIVECVNQHQSLFTANRQLLEALEMALSAHLGDWQKGSGWEKKARTAIAKAKGETL